MIRFGAYLFLFFVTLIGVTSILNTITTSISLRRRGICNVTEFGLSPRGFVKMNVLESLFFGVKSLLYGIPLSLGCVYLIAQILGLGYLALPDEQKYQFPFPLSIFYSALFCIFHCFCNHDAFNSENKERKHHEIFRRGIICSLFCLVFRFVPCIIKVSKEKTYGYDRINYKKKNHQELTEAEIKELIMAIPWNDS